MAKDINDTTPPPGAAQLPTQGVLFDGISSYRSLNEKKKDIANKQKAQLKEFCASNATPEWVFKTLLKLQDIEDEAIRGYAWRALMHGGNQLGFDQLPAEPEKTAPVPKSERATKARAHA